MSGKWRKTRKMNYWKVCRKNMENLRSSYTFDLLIRSSGNFRKSVEKCFNPDICSITRRKCMREKNIM